jgi:hypothetical protein
MNIIMFFLTALGFFTSTDSSVSQRTVAAETRQQSFDRVHRAYVKQARPLFLYFLHEQDCSSPIGVLN